MPASQFYFQTGQHSFVEIHVPTFTPFDWVILVRRSFSSLLECFHEPLPSEAAGLHTYAVSLLYSLHPLPAQMQAGLKALSAAPDVGENEGYYFTPNGLALRIRTGSFNVEWSAHIRALLAVGQYSGYRLADEVRAGYFELLGALIPPLAPMPVSDAADTLPTCSQHR